jgi:hypothetical protein
VNLSLPVVAVVALLFGVLAYLRTSAFRRQRGQNPWGMSPGVWLVVGILLGLIGMILALIACATTRRGTVAPATAPGASAPTNHEAGSELQPAGPPPGWYPDPAGAHQLRYFSSPDWSDQVLDNGVPSTDPLPPGPIGTAPRLEG